MRIISGTKVCRADEALSWSSRIVERTGVLGVIFFFAWLLNPVQALGDTLPGSYSVALTWDPSPSSEVIGYYVYSGTESGNYTNRLGAGNATTITVPALAGGVTYFFAITAVGAAGLESDFSNEITFVPGLPAVRIRVTPAGQVVLTAKGLIGQRYDILASQTVTDWTVIGTVTPGASGSVDLIDTSAACFPNRFYRTQQMP